MWCLRWFPTETVQLDNMWLWRLIVSSIGVQADESMKLCDKTSAVARNSAACACQGPLIINELSFIVKAGETESV